MALEDSEALLASLQEPARFALIFELHHDAVWRFLARSGGQDFADEAAGDVFVNAFAHRERYDPAKGSVRAWLYGIATNLQRMHLRSDARRERAFERAAVQLTGSGMAFDRADEEVATSAELQRVNTALSLLSERHREILVLFVWEYLSYEEIAAALDIELGTVRSRLARARAELRKLAGIGAMLPDEIKK